MKPHLADISALRTQRGYHAQKAGKDAEDKAEDYFVNTLGFILLAKRQRTPCGEIDLLVGNDMWLIAIEVKHRTTLNLSAYALQVRQQQRLLNAFAYLLETHPEWQRPNTRFDVFLSDGNEDYRHIEDALRFF